MCGPSVVVVYVQSMDIIHNHPLYSCSKAGEIANGNRNWGPTLYQSLWALLCSPAPRSSFHRYGPYIAPYAAPPAADRTPGRWSEKQLEVRFWMVLGWVVDDSKARFWRSTTANQKKVYLEQREIPPARIWIKVVVPKNPCQWLRHMKVQLNKGNHPQPGFSFRLGISLFFVAEMRFTLR